MSFAGNVPRPDRAHERAEAGAASTAGASRASTSRGASATVSRATAAPGTAPGTAPGGTTTRPREGRRARGGEGTRERGPGWRGGGEVDWGRLGAFGLGIALGALIGAGSALLYAPQSGRVTRARLGRQARHLTVSAGDAWDGLGLGLRGVTRRGRRRVTRGVTRGRWKAADLIEA